MICTLIAAAMLLFQSAPVATTSASKSEAPPPAAAEVQQVDKSKTLQKVRRIYVDTFGTTEAAQQLQAMLVASVTESKRLTVTEDKTKADAILKGFASEKTSQETHAYGSATAVSSAGGGHSGSISGSNGHVSGSSSGGWRAAGAAIDDSSVNTETIDSAKASVRLVNNDGDVIWTSTQESKGAKYKGASADVADKIVKQLIRDIEKSEKTALASDVPK
jgi:hypothetical protein